MAELLKKSRRPCGPRRGTAGSTLDSGVTSHAACHEPSATRALQEASFGALGWSPLVRKDASSCGVSHACNIDGEATRAMTSGRADRGKAVWCRERDALPRCKSKAQSTARPAAPPPQPPQPAPAQHYSNTTSTAGAGEPRVCWLVAPCRLGMMPQTNPEVFQALELCTSRPVAVWCANADWSGGAPPLAGANTMMYLIICSAS